MKRKCRKIPLTKTEADRSVRFFQRRDKDFYITAYWCRRHHHAWHIGHERSLQIKPISGFHEQCQTRNIVRLKDGTAACLTCSEFDLVLEQPAQATLAGRKL